jgi:hypothetical protein
MPRVGFEITIPAFERAETVHALDRAATVIGESIIKRTINLLNGCRFFFNRLIMLYSLTLLTNSTLIINKIHDIHLMGEEEWAVRPEVFTMATIFWM